MPASKGSVPTVPSGWHHCPAIGAHINPINCNGITSAYQRNLQSCCRTQCASPLRLCTACIIQGHTDELAYSTNPQTGFCDFHTTKGAAARRQKYYVKSGAGYSEKRPISAEIPREYCIPGSSGRTGGEIHFGHYNRDYLTRVGENPKPTTASVDIQQIANKIPTLHRARQTQLATLVGNNPAISVAEVAAIMGIKRASVDVLFNHLFTNLGIPTKESPANKRNIMKQAWQLANPTKE